MLEVHVVTDRNRALYEGGLPAATGGMPGGASVPAHLLYQDDLPACRDPMATGDAVVLLGFRHGRLAAASRLMPCCGPTPLRTLAPELAAEQGLPDRADWADWTRLPVATDADEEASEAVFRVMACAVMEYCLDEDVEWVGGVQEAYWLPRWESLGWRVRALGLPRAVDGVSRIAAFTRVDEASLASARRAAGVRRPLVRHHGERKPFLPAFRLAPFSTSTRPEVDHAS